MNNQNQAFTLVELIVVITILAILGTIAFISLQGYASQARDSKRLSDIQNIKTSLELFSLNTGKYPFPDNSNEVTYNLSLLWKQGVVGDNVTTNLSRNLNTKPLDPLTEKEYTYSVTHNQLEYELLSIYESDLVSSNTLLNQAKAENRAYPKVDGTYNGVFIKITDYYIPTPSIINSEILDSDIVLDNTNIKSQIITGGENNLAYSINDLQKDGLPGLELVPYNGTITSESDDTEKIALVEALQDAYTGSVLANKDIYLSILNTTEDDMEELVDNYILGGDIIISNWNDDEGGDVNPYLVCTTQGEKFEAGTYYGNCSEKDIIVCDGLGSGYTIASCNIGTDIAGTGSDSYGKYFQWGNNYGSIAGGPSSNTLIEDVSTFGPGKYYTSTSFIYGTTIDFFYDWTKNQNDNLWGYNDYINGGSIDKTLLKGPCNDGYHIPTADEWSSVVNAGNGFLWFISGTNEGNELKNILKIPIPGYRHWSNANMYYNSNGTYWTSTYSSNDAYVLYFYDERIFSGTDVKRPRGNGFPIRCFKN